MSKRPNILLISADQHRADCFGFEGRNIRTPHLDELAASGTRFSNCITPCVVCQPARASILTGQLPRTHGVHDNGIDLEPAIGERGFGGALSAAGYDTAYFGKAHFSTYHTFSPTGSPECVTSSEEYPDDWYGPYMGFDHVELMLLGHNWFLPERPPRGQHYERWFYRDGKGDLRNELYRRNARDTRGAAQTWHSCLPVAWHNSTWTADRTISWLGSAGKDNPFCAWVSFPDPHHPFDCPVPWSCLHDPATIDLPEHRTRNFEGRPWWHEASVSTDPVGDPKAVEMRKNYSRIPEQGDDQLREIIANTYGQIALIDHQVGRILLALDEHDLRENTIVAYISDHGDWLGDHGLVLKGPMHFEGLLRVPMIFSGPGMPRGKIVDDPVSTLDLAPTFTGIAGAERLHRYHGECLTPQIDGTGPPREFAMNEWDLSPARVGVELSLRTVRTRSHKLTIEMNTGAGELYDLSNDPHEMNNRFEDRSLLGIRRELERMLEKRPDDIRPIQQPVGSA